MPRFDNEEISNKYDIIIANSPKDSGLRKIVKLNENKKNIDLVIITDSEDQKLDDNNLKRTKSFFYLQSQTYPKIFLSIC